MTEQGSTSVQAAPGDHLPAQEIAPWQSSAQLSVWSTLVDPATTLSAMATEASVDGQSVINVAHLVVHDVQLTDDETGEISVRQRAVLIQPDGRAYAAVSIGVIRSLQQIAALYGSPPWDPPLLLEPRAFRTRKGYRVLRLVPAKE